MRFYKRDRRIQRKLLTQSERDWLVQFAEYAPLNDRERVILGSWLSGSTLEDMAAVQRVSRERIRQLLAKSLSVIQRTSKNWRTHIRRIAR